MNETLLLFLGFEVCNDALQMLGGYGYLKVSSYYPNTTHYYTIVSSLTVFYYTVSCICVRAGLRHRALCARLPRAPDPRGNQRDYAPHRGQGPRQQINYLPS